MHWDRQERAADNVAEFRRHPEAKGNYRHPAARQTVDVEKLRHQVVGQEEQDYRRHDPEKFQIQAQSEPQYRIFQRPQRAEQRPQAQANHQGQSGNPDRRP